MDKHNIISRVNDMKVLEENTNAESKRKKQTNKQTR
jgi:hypothetical protein